MSAPFAGVDAEIVSLWEEGLTSKQIAARTGRGQPGVANILRKNGIDPRWRCGGGEASLRTWHSWTPEEIAAVEGAKGRREAIERYRLVFPTSTRSDSSIRGGHRRYGRCLRG